MLKRFFGAVSDYEQVKTGMKCDFKMTKCLSRINLFKCIIGFGTFSPGIAAAGMSSIYLPRPIKTFHDEIQNQDYKTRFSTLK